MKSTVLSRREVLKTLLLSATSTGISPHIYAGGILIKSDMINWITGCFMPRPNSISFDSARSNVLTAIRTNQKTFENTHTTFEYINDLQNAITVEQFLNQKQAQGFLSFETQALGLGSFLKKLNGVLHNPTQSQYWKLKINGRVSQYGISQTVLSLGDKISFTLGSALNDQIVLVDSLGDYTKSLVSESVPLWNGKLQTLNDWPLEYGSLWYEFCEIICPEGTHFIPHQIQYIKHIEQWDPGTQSWISLSKIIISTSANDFIGQSWNALQETNIDQASTRMIFGGTGTGFSPLQGSSEMARITNRLAWLRSGRVRIRTVIIVPVIGANGISQLVTSEKFSLKEEILFQEGSQPLRVLPSKHTLFTAPEGQEQMLYEIETSPDLHNWNSESFISNQESKELRSPLQTKRFWRVRRF